MEVMFSVSKSVGRESVGHSGCKRPAPVTAQYATDSVHRQRGQDLGEHYHEIARGKNADQAGDQTSDKNEDLFGNGIITPVCAKWRAQLWHFFWNEGPIVAVNRSFDLGEVE